MSTLRADSTLPPKRFLVLISVRSWVNPRNIVRLEGIGKMEKPNDLIENRIRDLPSCSIAPQPTTLIHRIHERMMRFEELIKNCISHPARAQHTVSTGNCPRFSSATSSSLLMLTAALRDRFLRWSRSRRSLSVCSVLRCPDLWLQCSVSFVHGLKKTQHTRIM
jgi:hypothetical protein